MLNFTPQKNIYVEKKSNKICPTLNIGSTTINSTVNRTINRTINRRNGEWGEGRKAGKRANNIYYMYIVLW